MRGSTRSFVRFERQTDEPAYYHCRIRDITQKRQQKKDTVRGKGNTRKWISEELMYIYCIHTHTYICIYIYIHVLLTYKRLFRLDTKVRTASQRIVKLPANCNTEYKRMRVEEVEGERGEASERQKAKQEVPIYIHTYVCIITGKVSERQGQLVLSGSHIRTHMRTCRMKRRRRRSDCGVPSTL